MDKHSVLSVDEAESLASRLDFSMFSRRELLITGASGMIGAYIAATLIEGCALQGLTPPNLTLLSRSLKSGNISMFSGKSNVRVIQTELLAWQVDRSYDFLVHAASPASPTKYGNSESVIQANLGFLQSLQKQDMPKSTLYISSGEVYGASPPRKVKETFTEPVIPPSSRSIYPEAKIASESLLWEMGANGSTEPFVARLFHSFGPGLKIDDGRSFGDFLFSAARGEDIHLLSNGESIRTFLYIEDAVAGLLTLLTKGIPGEPYNIGSDIQMSISEFAELVGAVAGVKVHFPSIPIEPKSEYIQSPNQVVIPSITKVSNLGWSPAVPLDSGVERTLDWIVRKLRIEN